MYSAGILGCFILLYAPLAAAATAALMVHPQLLIIALCGAIFALAALFVTSLSYALLQHLASSAFFLILHVAVAGTLRMLLLLLLYRADCCARREGQVLVASRVRFALVGLAAGFGFGAVSVMRGAGTLLDATQRLTFYSEGTMAYDIHSCTRIPLLLHSTIQAFLLLFCQVAWALVTGQALASLQLMQPQVTHRRCGNGDYRPAPQQDDVNVAKEAELPFDTVYMQLEDLVTPKQSGSMTDRSTSPELPNMEKQVVPAQQQKPSDTLSQFERDEELPLLRERSLEASVGEREETENSTCPAAVEENAGRGREGESPRNDDAGTEEEVRREHKEPSVEIPAATVLSNRSPVMMKGLLAAVLLLHLVFALVSLLNSGAYDDEKFEEVQLRGCVLTLPLQATIALVSLLIMTAVWLNELSDEKV